MGYDDPGELQTAPKGHHPQEFGGRRAKIVVLISTQTENIIWRASDWNDIYCHFVFFRPPWHVRLFEVSLPSQHKALEETFAHVTKKAKKSIRNIINCFEFGIPKPLCCSSCQKYIEIDDKKWTKNTSLFSILEAIWVWCPVSNEATQQDLGTEVRGVCIAEYSPNLIYCCKRKEDYMTYYHIS
jgi:hypothetical protein